MRCSKNYASSITTPRRCARHPDTTRFAAVSSTFIRSPPTSRIGSISSAMTSRKSARSIRSLNAPVKKSPRSQSRPHPDCDSIHQKPASPIIFHPAPTSSSSNQPHSTKNSAASRARAKIASRHCSPNAPPLSACAISMKPPCFSKRPRPTPLGTPRASSIIATTPRTRSWHRSGYRSRQRRDNVFCTKSPNGKKTVTKSSSSYPKKVKNNAPEKSSTTIRN